MHRLSAAEFEHISAVVHTLRRVTASKKRKEILSHVTNMLQNLERVSSSSLKFIVGGRRVCRETFFFAHGIAQSTGAAALSRFNKEYQTRNAMEDHGETEEEKAVRRQMINIGISSDVLRDWMSQYIFNTAHFPPNDRAIELSSIQPHTLYPQYKRWCVETSCSAVKEPTFRREWSKIVKDMGVRIKASKKGTAQCGICARLKCIRNSMIRLGEKALASELLARHMEFVGKEGLIYYPPSHLPSQIPS